MERMLARKILWRSTKGLDRVVGGVVKKLVT